MEDKNGWDYYVNLYVDGGSPVVRIGCMGHGITFSGTIIFESPQYIEAVNDAFAIALTELNLKLTPTKNWYLEECDELPKTVKLYPTPSEEENDCEIAFHKR